MPKTFMSCYADAEEAERFKAAARLSGFTSMGAALRVSMSDFADTIESLHDDGALSGADVDAPADPERRHVEV